MVCSVSESSAVDAADPGSGRAAGQPACAPATRKRFHSFLLRQGFGGLCRRGADRTCPPKRAKRAWPRGDGPPSPRLRRASASRALGADLSAEARIAREGGWCCRGGLNSRPPPYQGGALPLSYGSARRGVDIQRHLPPDKFVGARLQKADGRAGTGTGRPATRAPPRCGAARKPGPPKGPAAGPDRAPGGARTGRQGAAGGPGALSRLDPVVYEGRSPPAGPDSPCL
ncbi:MAG: hypothetical protein JWM77_1172 [Rhodospirillales bacterium]|nr:hypothetical protein [Rhodospirillales bacterium]